MKPLNRYTKNGHDFNLVRRHQGIAIFHGVSKTNGSETWEVIKIQSHNGREIAGKFFDAAEYAPSNQQWGTHGFTFQTLADAVIKFRELQQKETP